MILSHKHNNNKFKKKSANVVMFSPMSTSCFVCWFLCQQDHTKTTEPIWIHLCEGWGLVRADMNSVADPGVFFLTILNMSTLNI